MIILFLYGDISENVIHFGFKDPKFIYETFENQKFDPYMVFNIASALYGIGSELEGGNLRDLDLKYYKIFTKLKDSKLLLIGVKDFKKNDKKITILRDNIDYIHLSCQKIHKRIKSNQILTSGQLKGEIENYFKNLTFIKKDFKKLEQLLLK